MLRFQRNRSYDIRFQNVTVSAALHVTSSSVLQFIVLSSFLLFSSVVLKEFTAFVFCLFLVIVNAVFRCCFFC